LSLALLGVVLSETFAAKHGLGYLIMDAYAAYRLDRMVAVIGLLYAVAVAFALLPLPGRANRQWHLLPNRVGARGVVLSPAKAALRDQAAAR
jgi:ABC-type nitrate/sulfonate/bicarbonate transport system permease component